MEGLHKDAATVQFTFRLDALLDALNRRLPAELQRLLSKDVDLLNS